MHGFLNLGNTCYFNSALQCLLHTHQISEYIYKTPYEGECKFTELYKELVHAYFSTQKSGCFDVKKLLTEFQTTFPRFTMFYPHDAQDALFSIVDILEKTYPDIKKMIYGNKKQITISPASKTTHDVPFSVNILTATQGVSKVSSLIMKQSEWDTLEDYVDDDGVKHHAAVTRTILDSIPPILIVSFDKKSKIELEYTLTFDSKYKYELTSTILHSGVQQGGHYYSMTKFGDKWVAQDDETITEVKPNRVDSYYVLVYKRSS